MKTKKISAKEFETIVDKIKITNVTIEWNGLEILIKRNLNFDEMMGFVESVTDLCFSEETNTYLPQIKDFAIKAFIISNYANIELPKNSDKKYELIYGTDIITRILDVIDPVQFGDIMHAIDIKLDYMADSNITALNKSILEVSNIIEKFGNKFEESMGGLDTESMANLVDRLANGFDEEKLMNAYLDHQQQPNS